MKQRTVTTFETAEEVVRAFNPNNPDRVPDHISLLAEEEYIAFSGQGSDCFEIADDITFSNIAETALEMCGVRIGFT